MQIFVVMMLQEQFISTPPYYQKCKSLVSVIISIDKRKFYELVIYNVPFTCIAKCNDFTFQGNIQTEWSKPYRLKK